MLSKTDKFKPCAAERTPHAFPAGWRPFLEQPADSCRRENPEDWKYSSHIKPLA